MAFPISPTIGQEYTIGTHTYEWNGTAWDIAGSTTASAISDKADITYVNSKPTGFKNYIINGGFDVWQRSEGADYVATLTYKCADRWKFQRTTTSKVSTPYGNGVRLTDRASYSNQMLEQVIENTGQFKAGNEYTLSFYARGSRNCSGSASFRDTTNTYNVIDNVSYDITTEWNRVVLKGTLDTSTSNDFRCGVYYDNASLANDEWVEISNVQLELGSVATPFEQRPYGLELSLCQRYFRKFRCFDVASVAGEDKYFTFETMRTVPTVTRDDNAISSSEDGTVVILATDNGILIENPSNVKVGGVFSLDAEL